MNTTNNKKWLVERDGEEIAQFPTLREAKKFLESDGAKVSMLRYGKGGVYETSVDGIWINRE